MNIIKENKLRHGSLFSGIGGFDLAAEWAGWVNVFHCDNNSFCQRVLNYYWPDADSYKDIHDFNGLKYYEAVDVISGGFPCQPFSIAGKREGTRDHRNLWPEMFKVIKNARPTWVVAENVYGITNWERGMVFNQVLSDLESIGYETQTFIIPACAVNAPHRRDRVWFVAYSADNGNRNRLRDNENGEEKNIGRKEQPQFKFRKKGSNGVITHTISSRHRRLTQKTGNNKSGKDGSLVQNCGWNKDEIWSKTKRCGKVTSNPINQGLQRNEQYREYEKENKSRETGTHGTTTKFYRGDNWRSWPTQPPVCSRNDGLSTNLDGITLSKHRNESIKAYGNAIVPQIAYKIFKFINEVENGCK